jgi:hypothetical protein
MRKTTAAFIAVFLLLIPVSRAMAQPSAVVYINGQDALSVPAGEGWRYDNATHTLTLDNAQLTHMHNNSEEGRGALIYSSGDLKIYFSGENQLRGDGSQLCGGIVVEGDLTLTAPDSSWLNIASTPAGGISAQKLKITGGSVIAAASDNTIFARSLDIANGSLTGSAEGNKMSGVFITENINLSGTASLTGGARGDGGNGVYAGGDIDVSGASSLAGSALSGCGIIAEGSISVTGPESRVMGSSALSAQPCFGAIVSDGGIGGVIEQPDNASIVYFPYPDSKITRSTVIKGGLPASAATLRGIEVTNATKLPPVIVILFALIFVLLGSTLAIAIYRKIKYESKRWI